MIPVSCHESISGIRAVPNARELNKRLRMIKLIISTAVKQSGLKSVKRFIFMSHPGENHWDWTSIDYSSKEIRFYDSQGTFQESLMMDLIKVATYLAKWNLRRNIPFKIIAKKGGWDTSIPIRAKNPLQTDGYSCGPFTCLLIENFLKGGDVDLSQDLVSTCGRYRIFMVLCSKLWRK